MCPNLYLFKCFRERKMVWMCYVYICMCVQYVSIIITDIKKGSGYIKKKNTVYTY